MAERCAECKYQRDGECHMMPPVRLPRKFSETATAGNRIRDELLLWGWPVVLPEQWCGYFSRASAKDSR